MSNSQYSFPKVVSRKEWLAERKALLEEEKNTTRMLDKVRAKRRRLPMVKVEKKYKFEGPNGNKHLLDLFEGRRQLMVHHFMWFEEPDTFCHGCSLEADQNYNAAFFAEMESHDVTIAAVSRAPFHRIQQEKTKKGWNFPFYSSHGTDFNYDFQATLHQNRNTEFNYHPNAITDLFDGYEGDLPARSVFLKNGDTVYHAYSAYTRGLGFLATHYIYLDLTPYGRQESWEDSPDGWPQRATYD